MKRRNPAHKPKKDRSSVSMVGFLNFLMAAVVVLAISNRLGRIKSPTYLNFSARNSYFFNFIVILQSFSSVRA